MSILFSKFSEKFFLRGNFPGKDPFCLHKLGEKGGIGMDERLSGFLEFCLVLALNFFVIGVIRALCG